MLDFMNYSMVIQLSGILSRYYMVVVAMVLIFNILLQHRYTTKG